jgi:hypothetical protein
MLYINQTFDCNGIELPAEFSDIQEICSIAIEQEKSFKVFDDRGFTIAFVSSNGDYKYA